MTQQDLIQSLKQGEMITVNGENGCPVDFNVNVGDALLNGDQNQVWLENGDSGNRLYLRRMPEKRMSVGPALFSSFAELARTLASGNYYIS